MKTEILNFIADEILNGQSENEISSADDLLTSEIVDSMGIMRLLAFVETQFDIKIPPADVTIENFVSVDAICAYLDRKVSGSDNDSSVVKSSDKAID